MKICFSSCCCLCMYVFIYIYWYTSDIYNMNLQKYGLLIFCCLFYVYSGCMWKIKGIAIDTSKEVFKLWPMFQLRHTGCTNTWPLVQHMPGASSHYHPPAEFPDFLEPPSHRPLQMQWSDPMSAHSIWPASAPGLYLFNGIGRGFFYSVVCADFIAIIIIMAHFKLDSGGKIGDFIHKVA